MGKIDEDLDEVTAGYLDGLKPDSPEPSVNRSSSYRFGFANGRDDLAKSPRGLACMIRAQGKIAKRDDEGR